MEQIKQHEEWFKNYEHLKEKHKQAIEKWKASKKKEKIRKDVNDDSSRRKNSMSSDSTENNKKKNDIAEWKVS